MDHRRGERFKGPHSEDEAGQAFVQEARESLGMSNFVLSDSLTFAPMHTIVNLSTIVEEHDSPNSNIPRTVKRMAECSCSEDSVVKKDLLDGVIEIDEAHNPALFRENGRSFSGTTTNTRETCFSRNGRASQMDRRLLSFKSSWTLGSSSKEPRNMSTTAATTFKLKETRIVLQGLTARFESSKIVLGNNKAPSQPKRQKSINNIAEGSLDDDDESIIDTTASSTEQGPPNANDHPRHRLDSSR